MALGHEPKLSREESLNRTLALAELLNWSAQLPSYRDPVPAQNLLGAFKVILSETRTPTDPRQA